MDLNEKLAQRRRERSIEAEIMKNNNAAQNDINDTDTGIKKNDKDSIDIRIKNALNSNSENKSKVTILALKKFKTWEWFVVILGVIGSFSAMGESFMGGAFFILVFIWYAKISLDKYEIEVVREQAALDEAKHIFKDKFKE